MIEDRPGVNVELLTESPDGGRISPLFNECLTKLKISPAGRQFHLHLLKRKILYIC